ncbi:MAG: hypothetical protein ACC682_06020 [Gemmatimonadota bacterium]
MRLTSRFLALALVVLAAFWFTAENAGEMVFIDLVLFRLRVSVPLLVFGSVLAGMGLALFVGWRADRRAKQLAAPAERSLLQDRQELFDPSMPGVEMREQDPGEHR